MPKPLTKAQKIERLSPAAKRILERLKQGTWYRTSDPTTPKAMQQLVELGLVEEMFRVKSIVRCYVPKGAVPHCYEKMVPDDADVKRDRVERRLQAVTDAANALVDALDECHDFEVEAGAMGEGPIYDMCVALGRKLPENFKEWLKDND